MSKRKSYDDKFKAKVVLETIKGEKTLSELSSQYGVHPTMIAKWKSHFLENASQVFSHKQDPRLKSQKELIESLYKKIGQKEIEVDFLKKSTRNTWRIIKRDDIG
jgi:putative transposase